MPSKAMNPPRWDCKHLGTGVLCTQNPCQVVRMPRDGAVHVVVNFLMKPVDKKEADAKITVVTQALVKVAVCVHRKDSNIVNRGSLDDEIHHCTLRPH